MSGTQPIRPRGLHHVAYATRDPEATYEFYAKKLGMPLVRTENHRLAGGYFRHLFFDTGNGDALAFFEVHDVGERPDFRTDISRALGLPVWVNHIAFRLDTLDELAAMTGRLHAHGIDEVRQIDHGWAMSIYTRDPNGILIEFCVTTDAQQFAQSEEEALGLMRLPADQIPETTRKEADIGTRV